MVPAYAANMTPPFVKYWKGWNPPIARRHLGDHKTVLGFSLGVCAAVVATFIQARIAWEGSIVTYEQWLPLGLGLGFGAMAGDSAKSFVKRRVGIAPGQSWIPFDQLDFVIGALVITAHRVSLSWLDWALVLAVSGPGAIVVTRLGHWLGIRATKW
jgi:CDP-2,3-bis-(O-geranylgeranyl)-sn-glycerol synthase